jgi:hypothetical protein
MAEIDLSNREDQQALKTSGTKGKQNQNQKQTKSSSSAGASRTKRRKITDDDSGDDFVVNEKDLEMEEMSEEMEGNDAEDSMSVVIAGTALLSRTHPIIKARFHSHLPPQILCYR